MESLPDLPPITRLSPNIIRILGGNPGKFTLQGSNTYLVGKGPRRILIDSGEGRPEWKESLSRVLADEKTTVSQLILTHWHHDHVGGVADLKELCPDAKIYKSKLHDAHVAENDIVHGQQFESDSGVRLKAVHSPGHTVDHFAFVMDEDGSMFTADNVLGHGTAVFEDLKAYMESLEIMGKEFHEGKVAKAYPGHGEVIPDGGKKIKEYISHRKQREDQILAVLKKGRKEEGQEEDGWSSMGIVKVVYKGYPENLFIPAEGGVKQILAKLDAEGKVQQVQGSRWVLSDKSSL